MPSKPDRDSVFPIVGVGASAGGIEAFTALLKSLPDNPGASFVFILHQDPHHTSDLPEILKRATRMPVQVVQSGTRVEADHVYVAPPDAEVTIENGELQLHKRPAGMTLPIDVFFRALAEDQGGRAISVVLSGSASDGTLGTKVVKGEGGITFAQDASAKMHGMPRSAIEAGFVDFVQTPEEMAKEIVRIAQHDYVTGEARGEDRLPEDDVMTLLKLVQSAHDIDLTHYKPSTIQRRIRRRMALRKVHTVRDYLGVIREDPGEIEQLYGDIFIRVTGFFRDPEVFQALGQQVFPELLRERREGDPVRIWIPGCATGEEVYSIAISLLETATNGSFFCPAQIFGTDVSEPAIAHARSGIYPESIAGEVSAERLRRFFTRADSGYRVNKAVRDCCIFARQNVTQDPPFSKLDLISCRNVMIYFGSALQRKVLSIFHFALRPTGFLLLGTAETIGDFADLFSAVDKKHRIYRKKSAINRPNVDFDHAVPSPRIHAEEERMTPLSAALHEADRVLLARFSPAGVLINENMEVLQFRGHTSRFLEPAPGTASFNLMKMAREGLLGDLRAAIREGRKSESPARREGVQVKFDEHDLTINLEVIPVRGPSNERFHLVLFEEPATPAQKGPRRKAKKGRGPVKGESREATRLKRELEATREYPAVRCASLRASPRASARRDISCACGGPGGSFLYVDPELRPKLEPSFTGWMAHANPFGFEPPPMRFRDDALRFALGTPPIPALYAAREGPKIIAEADVARIREKSLRQTQKLIDLASARGFELRTPHDAHRRGGSVSMRVPHGREVSLELNAEDIVCDYRPASGVRFSPHFYTTDEEIDEAFVVVDDILRTGRWKRQEARKTIVT